MTSLPLLAAPVFAPLRCEATRGNRAAPGPAASRRAQKDFAPSAGATLGCLSIFIEGARLENPRMMMFGLSVLRSASVEQIHAARTQLAGSGVTDAAEIDRLLGAA